MEHQKKYVLKKDFTCNEGVLKAGSEIYAIRGTYYYNGGMVMPSAIGLLRKLIETKELKQEYLTETIMPYNKV